MGFDCMKILRIMQDIIKHILKAITKQDTCFLVNFLALEICVFLFLPYLCCNVIIDLRRRCHGYQLLNDWLA